MSKYFNKAIIKKLSIYAVLSLSSIWMALLAISVAVVGFIRLDQETYKHKLENLVHQETGYNLSITNLNVGLQSFIMPAIELNGISLSNPKVPSESLHINKIRASLSILSLLTFKIVTREVLIDGVDLRASLNKKSDYVINGLNISELIRNSTGGSKFDVEEFLLDQRNIKLSNIKYSFNDELHTYPSLNPIKVGIDLHNGILNKHNGLVTIFDEDGNKILVSQVEWIGGKLENFAKFDKIKVSVYSNYQGVENDNNWGFLTKLKSITQDISSKYGYSKEFNENSIASLEIQKGVLEKLNFNFDLTPVNFFIGANNFIKIPHLGGKIFLVKTSSNSYKIVSENLKVLSGSLNLADKSSVNGYIVRNSTGNVAANNIDLSIINIILGHLSAFDGLSVNGNLKLLSYSWDGKIFAPHNIKVNAELKDFMLKSKRKAVPSLDHLDAKIAIVGESGTADIALNNSTLIYPFVFQKDIKLNKLTSTLSWNIKESELAVNLGKTIIQTPDFIVNATGSYVLNKKYPVGYMVLNASLPKILERNVDEYLPVQIPKSVHQWLYPALDSKTGYATNGKLLFSGDLRKFPYKDNSGKFYIDAEIHDASLDYLKNWPLVEGVSGTFAIRNQKILVHANRGKVLNINVLKADAVIADMTSEKSSVVIDGTTHSTTEDALDYLRKSDLNKMLQKFPEQVHATGSGDAKVHLDIPFDHPIALKIDGKYKFDNNTINFDFKVPELTNVNGVLDFTQTGVATNNLTANIFNNNPIGIKASNNNGEMHFKVHSDKIDYNVATRYYVGNLANLINGNSSIDVDFDINKSGFEKLNLKSNLYGVSLNAPDQLAKTENEYADISLELMLKNSQLPISINYNDILFGNVLMSDHGDFLHADFAFGKKEFISDAESNARITFNIMQKNINVMSWLSGVSSVLSAKIIDNEIKPKLPDITSFEGALPSYGLIESLSIPALTVESIDLPKIALSAESSEHSDAALMFLPIQVEAQTSGLIMLGNNFGGGSASILVERDIVTFSAILNRLSANGLFNINDNTLSIYASNLELLSNSKINNNIDIESEIQEKESSGYLYSQAVLPHNDAFSFNMPKTDITIDDFKYDNYDLGSLAMDVHRSNDDLVIDNAALVNSQSTTVFNLINTNFFSDKYSGVDLEINSHTKNVGKFLAKVGAPKVIENGSSDLYANLHWRGNIDDFSLDNVIGIIYLNMKNGKFAKSQGVLGGLLSFFNLQTLVEVSTLGFNELFSNGFFFSEFNLKSEIRTRKLEINSAFVQGPSAAILSSGNYYLKDNTINAYVSVTPKISQTLAITVAVATGLLTFNPLLGPIIGATVYAGENSGSSIISKAMTFTYHVTGDINDPDVKAVNISDKEIAPVAAK